jgi:hypothetical protein
LVQIFTPYLVGQKQGKSKCGGNEGGESQTNIKENYNAGEKNSKPRQVHETLPEEHWDDVVQQEDCHGFWMGEVRGEANGGLSGAVAFLFIDFT